VPALRNGKVVLALKLVFREKLRNGSERAEAGNQCVNRKKFGNALAARIDEVGLAANIAALNLI